MYRLETMTYDGKVNFTVIDSYREAVNQWDAVKNSGDFVAADLIVVEFNHRACGFRDYGFDSWKRLS